MEFSKDRYARTFIKFSKEEKELITEAIEYWMEQLKIDSTFELPNTEKYYKCQDILDQINK
jgi:hypothetical protein